MTPSTKDRPRRAPGLAGSDALALVRRYRRAARIAVRRETASVKTRLLAILDLMAGARAETDSTVRAWAEKAIKEEVEDFVGFEKFSDERPVTRGDRLARRHRQLRAEGYEQCEHCYSRLLDEPDFAREAAIRQGELERLQAREGAVSDE